MYVKFEANIAIKKLLMNVKSVLILDNIIEISNIHFPIATQGIPVFCCHKT